MMLHSLTGAAALLASLFAPAGPQQGAPPVRFDPGSLPALDLSPGQGVAADVDGGYRPDPAVRRKLADIMGEAAGREGAAQEAEMRQIVLSGRAVAEYEKVAPRLGYSANDAIDGLAFYMLAQWGVANDHRPDITRAQAAGVRRQAANAFARVADQVDSEGRLKIANQELSANAQVLQKLNENNGATKLNENCHS